MSLNKVINKLLDLWNINKCIKKKYNKQKNLKHIVIKSRREKLKRKRNLLIYKW